MTKDYCVVMNKAVIFKFLKAVETTLNGEPFLLHWEGDIPTNVNDALFQLKEKNVITELIQFYYDGIDQGLLGPEDEKKYLYQKMKWKGSEVSSKNEESISSGVTEITPTETKGILKSMLDTSSNAYVDFSSPYKSTLSEQDADRLSNEFFEELIQAEKDSLNFYIVEPKTVHIVTDDDQFPYFLSLGGDSVLVIKGESNLFILLTTGTD